MGLRSLPVPFTERRGRLPQAGRIRDGVRAKNSKGEIRPKAIGTFRFTSPRQDDLSLLAQTYGGQVEPWRDPKSEDRFEVITDASEIRVILPADPLGDSPTYELWGGKGIERSCDGVTCEFKSRGPDGVEWASRPCLCRERRVKECKPKLRLSVILPGLPLRGTWRFDTSSDLAVDEMPHMVELILSAQERGLVWALLRLERRQSQGGSHHFVVPALGVPATLEELVAGENRVGISAPPRQIGVGGEHNPSALPSAPVDNDDDIIDAEVIEDETEPSPREKARLLRVARARAALEGREAPARWEDIG